MKYCNVCNVLLYLSRPTSPVRCNTFRPSVATPPQFESWLQHLPTIGCNTSPPAVCCNASLTISCNTSPNIGCNTLVPFVATPSNHLLQHLPAGRLLQHFPDHLLQHLPAGRLLQRFPDHPLQCLPERWLQHTHPLLQHNSTLSNCNAVHPTGKYCSSLSVATLTCPLQLNTALSCCTPSHRHPLLQCSSAHVFDSSMATTCWPPPTCIDHHCRCCHCQPLHINVKPPEQVSFFFIFFFFTLAVSMAINNTAMPSTMTTSMVTDSHPHLRGPPCHLPTLTPTPAHFNIDTAMEWQPIPHRQQQRYQQ